MGVYGDRVLPRLVHRVCGDRSLYPLRERVCSGLAGEVLELGFGSGSNVRFYPEQVTRVLAVEPAGLAWQLAQPRVTGSRIPVVRVSLDGEALPLPDASVDAVLSTWSLCTIPDPGAALAEARRVLRPGGRLHFLEHGLAPDAGVRRWQRRLEPIQKRVAGGCHFTREIPDLITGAGFTIEQLDVFYQERSPKFAGADSLGVAVRD